jgi:RNase H-fold protein (predicted Holliday junction resolvase)
MLNRLQFKKYDKVRYVVLECPNKRQLHVYWQDKDKGLRFDVYSNKLYQYSFVNNRNEYVFDKATANFILEQSLNNENFL